MCAFCVLTTIELMLFLFVVEAGMYQFPLASLSSASQESSKCSTSLCKGYELNACFLPREVVADASQTQHDRFVTPLPLFELLTIRTFSALYPSRSLFITFDREALDTTSRLHG